jgi:hypothetical protein
VVGSALHSPWVCARADIYWPHGYVSVGNSHFCKGGLHVLRYRADNGHLSAASHSR